MPQPRVFLLQTLHPLRLLQLQPAVFLAPTIEGLLNDTRLPAGLRSAPAIAYGHLDLTQNPDDLLRRVFSPGHFSAPLVTVSLSLPLVQNSPVTSHGAPARVRISKVRG